MDSVDVNGRRGVTNKRRAPANKNKPGRPEGLSNVRDEILDAAEIVFADLGYAGTTLREVADSAQVTQALINYYFGSKYGLFEQVFLRRGSKVSDERLDALRQLKQNGPYDAKHIVLAFLSPTLALRGTKNGRAFIRLQARLHTEPPEVSYKLRNEAYNASTRAYVEAFREVVPHLTECEAYWRVTLMVGAYMYAFSDTHRLEELAGDICDPDDSQEVLEQMSAFVTAGLQAPSVMNKG